MNRFAFGSQAIVTANNLLLSLSAILYLEGDDFKAWFILSQTFFITQTFLRSAFFEPANFKNLQVSITLRSGALIVLLICLFNFFVIGFSFEFNFINAFLESLAICISLLQDHLRYKFLSYIPQKVAIADGLVFISTILLIFLAKIDTVISFTTIYIALPNLISIIFLTKYRNNGEAQTEKFKPRSMPVYSFNGFTELGLNQALTVMSALFLSNSDLQSLRVMMLIVAPLTSLRLFTWTGLIIRDSKVSPTAGKKSTKLITEILYYLPLTILIFIFSDSSLLTFLPIYSRISLALVLGTNLISLVFVKNAVSIRKLGNWVQVLYFSSSFPLFSIAYLGILGAQSNVNDLIIVQFVVTLLNSVLSGFILRRDRVGN